MSNILAISLTPSFAEVAISSGLKRRFYLPKQGFAHIQKWLKENNFAPDKTVLVSRYLEKILHARMGGTVAQVVTAGFTDWLEQKQSPVQKYFTTSPHGVESLGSHELIFPVQERVLADGHVEKAIDLNELKKIQATLNKLEINKVSLNFIFSNKNSENLQKAKSFFSENNFEVFAPDEVSAVRDEASEWRRHLLAACLAGSLDELHADICKGLEIKPEDLLIFTGELEGLDCRKRLDHFKAWSEFWNKDFSEHLVLHLGLENWNFLLPEADPKEWTSPWGKIGNAPRGQKRSSLQPSLEILATAEEGLRVGYQEKGFEPGPCTLGRSLHLTLFDLMALAAQLKPLEDSDLHLKKAEDALLTMCKTHQKWRQQTPLKIAQSLLDVCAEHLALECALLSPQREIVVAGFYAPLLGPMIQNFVAQKVRVIEKSESELLLQEATRCL